MSYTPKKENASKLNKFMYSTSVNEELNKFHKKNVYERYNNATDEIKENLFKELCSNRIVWWNKQAGIEAKTIGQNPTEKNTYTRMNELNKKPDCTPVIFDAMVNYLKISY